MNADQELRRYLESLLEHQCMSGADNCDACRSLQRVYQMMQAEIFASIVYPEAALEPRHSGATETGAARRIAASLRRPHAS